VVGSFLPSYQMEQKNKKPRVDVAPATVPQTPPARGPDLKRGHPQQRARAAELRGPERDDLRRSLRRGPELGIPCAAADGGGVQDAVVRGPEDDRVRIMSPLIPSRS